MTRPRIEHRSLGPLSNTLLIYIERVVHEHTNTHTRICIIMHLHNSSKIIIIYYVCIIITYYI